MLVWIYAGFREVLELLNADRLQRAQARMREHGIDAYLVLTHDDYIYFFGEDRFQPRAIVPA